MLEEINTNSKEREGAEAPFVSNAPGLQKDGVSLSPQMVGANSPFLVQKSLESRNVGEKLRVNGDPMNFAPAPSGPMEHVSPLHMQNSITGRHDVDVVNESPALSQATAACSLSPTAVVESNCGQSAESSSTAGLRSANSRSPSVTGSPLASNRPSHPMDPPLSPTNPSGEARGASPGGAVPKTRRTTAASNRSSLSVPKSGRSSVSRVPPLVVTMKDSEGKALPAAPLSPSQCSERSTTSTIPASPTAGSDSPEGRSGTSGGAKSRQRQRSRHKSSITSSGSLVVPRSSGRRPSSSVKSPRLDALSQQWDHEDHGRVNGVVSRSELRSPGYRKGKSRKGPRKHSLVTGDPKEEALLPVFRHSMAQYRRIHGDNVSSVVMQVSRPKTLGFRKLPPNEVPILHHSYRDLAEAETKQRVPKETPIDADPLDYYYHTKGTDLKTVKKMARKRRREKKFLPRDDNISSDSSGTIQRGRHGSIAMVAYVGMVPRNRRVKNQPKAFDPEEAERAFSTGPEPKYKKRADKAKLNQDDPQDDPRAARRRRREQAQESSPWKQKGKGGHSGLRVKVPRSQIPLALQDDLYQREIQSTSYTAKSYANRVGRRSEELEHLLDPPVVSKILQRQHQMRKRLPFLVRWPQTKNFTQWNMMETTTTRRVLPGVQADPHLTETLPDIPSSSSPTRGARSVSPFSPKHIPPERLRGSKSTEPYFPYSHKHLTHHPSDAPGNTLTVPSPGPHAARSKSQASRPTKVNFGAARHAASPYLSNPKPGGSAAPSRQGTATSKKRTNSKDTHPKASVALPRLA
eukprot:Rmarinus@m.10230